MASLHRVLRDVRRVRMARVHKQPDFMLSDIRFQLILIQRLVIDDQPRIAFQQFFSVAGHHRRRHRIACREQRSRQFTPVLRSRRRKDHTLYPRGVTIQPS